MPLYIVRWANLSASLVHAEDEDHLEYLLDQVGDPGAAIWEEYDGPLWIEFEPDRRETEDGGIELVDDFHADTGPYDILKPSVAPADTCFDMYWNMMKRLFPHLYVALRKTAGSDLPDEEVKAIFKEAIEREDWHGRACAERADRYSDPDSLMGAFDLTVIPKHMGSTSLLPRDVISLLGRQGHDLLVDVFAGPLSVLEPPQDQYARLEAERERAFEELEDDDFDE